LNFKKFKQFVEKFLSTCKLHVHVYLYKHPPYSIYLTKPYSAISTFTWINDSTSLP